MKYFFLLLSLLSILSISSCKKDNPEPEDEQEEPIDSAQVSENHTVIDSSQQDLVSTPQQITDGEYVFNVNGGEIAEVGDIIVGIQNDGFLRKVTSVTDNGSQVIYQTEFASMDELFHDGAVSLDVNMNTSYQYKTNLSNGFQTNLYSANGVTIAASGNLSLSIPNFNTDITFKALGLGIESASFSSQGAVLNGDLTIDVNATGAVSLINEEVELAGFKQKFYGSLGALPVAGVITTDFIVKCEANIGASANSSIQFTNNSPIDFGCAYNNGTWSSNLDFTPNSSINFTPINGGVTFDYHAELVPVITIEFYNVGGPYGSVALNNDVEAAVQSPSMDWHVGSDVYLVSTIGVQAQIFSYSLPDYSTSWTSSSISYKTPNGIELVSGNNQTGSAGVTLTNPIKVQVLDMDGNAQSNVPVYFTVSSGGGTVSLDNVLSDGSGYAETFWTLGSSGNQELSVTAKDGGGNDLNGSPVSFSANSSVFDFTYWTLPDSLIVPGGEGEIQIATIGGIAPFQFKLGSGGLYQADSLFENVIAGTYEVYAKDANNTEVMKSVTVEGIP